jgi:radical SAM superfamily enzyme YgiQ (UPF0313 family)
MRVLFATKVVQDRNFQPLGLLYLSAVLKGHGHETALVDVVRPRHLERAIARHRPDVLAISTATGSFPFFARVAADVKRARPGLPIVFGGPHVMGRPSVVEQEGIDAVCLDEGEEAFVDYLARLEAGNSSETAGFWVKRDGAVVRNPRRPLLRDLDALPNYDLHLMDECFPASVLGMAIFLASRGCPYRCSFCFNDLLRSLRSGEGSPVRFRSPERVVEEVALRAREYGLRGAFFVDSTFGARLDLLTEFVERYRRDVALPFWCFLHPLVVTAERVGLLRDGGCRQVFLGIESGSPRIREEILKRKYSNEQALAAIRILRDHGIIVQASFILGAPGSDLTDDLQSVDLCIAGDVDFPDFNPYRPYPGVALAEEAQRLGLLRDGGEGHGGTINPRWRDGDPVRVAHADVLGNLALLAAVAAKVPWFRRRLKRLIRLPLGLVYAALYRVLLSWLKWRLFGRYFLRVNGRTVRVALRHVFG